MTYRYVVAAKTKNFTTYWCGWMYGWVSDKKIAYQYSLLEEAKTVKKHLKAIFSLEDPKNIYKFSCNIYKRKIK